MSLPITDEKALYTFLRSALERGEIKITPIKGACCSNKSYQIDSPLFTRPTFGLYLALRFNADDDPIDLIIKKMVDMLKTEQIELA